MIRISYVIPCYNAGVYLIESVKSVLSQTGNFCIVEILVIDDGSDDPVTKAALHEISLWRSVKVISNCGKKGAAGARNTGIRLACAEWIAFHDADDLVLPGGVAARVNVLDDRPNAEWIGADLVDFEGELTRGRKGRIEANLEFYSSLAPSFVDCKVIQVSRPIDMFIAQAPTNMIVPIIKTELVLKIGGFNEDISGQEDLHFYFRLALVADFVFVPSVVSAYRRHSGNITRSRVRTLGWEYEALYDLYRRDEFAPYRKPLRSRMRKVLLGINYAERRNSNFDGAVRSAFQAIKLNPFDFEVFKALAAGVLRRQ